MASSLDATESPSPNIDNYLHQENILSSQSLKELWELREQLTLQWELWESSHQAQKGNPEGKFFRVLP
ncbi:hypothetical protein FRC11_007191, partial [Ceratobasidium sp. 423]